MARYRLPAAPYRSRLDRAQLERARRYGHLLLSFESWPAHDAALLDACQLGGPAMRSI